MQRLAVVTSGGDAPGMNAAVRAVIRSALARGWQGFGVRHGYSGLIDGDLRPLSLRDVGGIIEAGGTMLGTTRCERFRSEAGQERALANLRACNIDTLVVIGGNGSQTGAWELARRGARVVGVASTIDNDLFGTDISIGATTATDVALQAINQLRATASAMGRAFLLEVMGRDCGYLALMAGIAGGAEVIAIPEVALEPEDLAAELRASYLRGKSHAIAVVAEGSRCSAEVLLQYLREHKERFGFDVRVTRLGHVQRGGAPGAFDRMLATYLGVEAVEAAEQGAFGVLIGRSGADCTRTALAEVAGRTRAADTRLLKLARTMAM